MFQYDISVKYFSSDSTVETFCCSNFKVNPKVTKQIKAFLNN